VTCRIGVNTGEVVAGQSVRQALVPATRSTSPPSGAVAPAGEILLSETTLRLVRDAVVVEAVERSS